MAKLRPIWTNFCTFFTVKFRKNLWSVEEAGIKTISSPQICCHTTLWKVNGHVHSFTAQLIQFRVMKKMFTSGKCSREMLFLCFSTQINLRHVFKMSAFGTYACFESWMPMVSGRINCALFNAMPNVYLYNWEVEKCNKQNITVMSSWCQYQEEKKINK